MAVTKMEKMTILAAADRQEPVLQTMQGLQNVEVMDLLGQQEQRQVLEQYFQINETEEDQPRLKDFQALHHQLQQSLTFIDRYGSNDAKKMKAIRRQTMTLEQLEHSFDEEETRQKLQQLKQLQTELEDVFAKRKVLLTEENWLGRWQYLDVDPHQVTDLRKTQMILGSINNVHQAEFAEALASVGTVYVEEIYHSKNHVYYCLIYLLKQAEAVKEIMARYSFSTASFSYQGLPKDAYQDVKQQLVALVEEEQRIKKDAAKFREEVEQLQLTEEMLLAYINREQAKDHVLTSKHLFLVQGWIPVDERELFLNNLYRTIPLDEILVEFDEPQSKEYKSVPTKLKNNKVVRPFEMLTEMYSLPKYDEIDPTPWMAPFYMVFFGMMVADIGYGLLMLIAAFLARKLFTLPRGMKRFADFFFVLSFPTIIWGFIYGSFFGIELPPTIFGIASPFPILSTTRDVNSILALSVVFGLIQILTGLAINGVMQVKRKQYLNSIGDGFAWMGILIGIVIAGLGKVLLNSDPLFLVGIAAAALSALLIVAVPLLQSASKGKGLLKGLYGLYGITGYIGDLVSYTRLMALGISGGSIAAAFNMLVAFMPPVARFTAGLVLIVLLHALNLFLTLLSAYVHGARLQYVEFFGKFYEGGGRPFAPLKTEEKYINIQANKLKNEK